MVLRGCQHTRVDAVVREAGQEVVIVVVVVEVVIIVVVVEAGQEVFIVLGLHGLQLPGVSEAGVWADLAWQREARLDGEGARHLVLTEHQEPGTSNVILEQIKEN